jgi:hypothetical protein
VKIIGFFGSGSVFTFFVGGGFILADQIDLKSKELEADEG